MLGERRPRARAQTPARALRHLRADDDYVLIEPIRQRMRELCGDRLGVADVPG